MAVEGESKILDALTDARFQDFGTHGDSSGFCFGVFGDAR